MTIQYTAQPADPASSAVLTRGLVKRYGDFLAVNGLNLNVPAHGVYGLLGPNGAGKSTMALTLAGLLKPIDGKVLIADSLKPPHAGQEPINWKARNCWAVSAWCSRSSPW